MPTCPACGTRFTDPAQHRAHQRHEATEARRAYRRDYYRGRRHAQAGKKRERKPSAAYRKGYGGAQ